MTPERRLAMEVLTITAARVDPAAIQRAADCLRRGGLVAFPTETVYGLGAHALNPDAVARIFSAKGRPSSDPLIVHVADVDQILPLVAAFPPAAHRLASRFWPGPLTLVLRKSAVVPDAVTAGLDTVAARVPAHPVARALLTTAGIPVAAPSANPFSRPSPTRASHVRDDLGDFVDIILDAGATEVGVESTVLDLSGATPTILRPGAIAIDALRSVLPDVRLPPATQRTPGESGPLRAPGLMAKHYAPRVPLTLYVGESDAALGRLLADARQASAAGSRVGVLVSSEDVRRVRDAAVRSAHVVDLGPRGDAAAVAATLYARLRELDAGQVDLILARAFDGDDGLWPAIHDRLRRAAAGRVVTV